MKRHGNLWERMISFESLLEAAMKAQRGKRFRPPVARFHFNLERELLVLQEELSAKTYGWGRIPASTSTNRSSGSVCGPDRVR